MNSMAKMIDEAAALLECKPEFVPGIMLAIGIHEACARCGGTGEFSFCETYGTKCFGCAGKKVRAAKLTKKTLAVIREKVEAGALISYRAERKALTEAKKELGPLVKRAHEIAGTISAEYEAAYKRAYRGPGADRSPIPEELYRAQHLNMFYLYGNNGNSSGFKEIVPSVSTIKYALEKKRRTDYMVMHSQLIDAIDALETLRQAWIHYWCSTPR